MTHTTLPALLERTAAGDRAALGLLFTTLSGPVAGHAGRMLSSAEAVQAVVNATFVEVWWLSRFYANPEMDVLAWVTAIAARRASEARRDLDDPALLNGDHHRVALEGLLDRRAGR